MGSTRSPKRKNLRVLNDFYLEVACSNCWLWVDEEPYYANSSQVLGKLPYLASQTYEGNHLDIWNQV